MLDQPTDYLISYDGEKLINDLAVQVLRGIISWELTHLKREKYRKEGDINRDRKNKNVPYLIFLLYFLFLITTLAPKPISTCGASSHADTGGCSNGAPRSADKPITLFLLFMILVLLTLIS